MPNKQERHEKMVRHLQERLRRERERKIRKHPKSVYELVDKPLVKEHFKDELLEEYYKSK